MIGFDVVLEDSPSSNEVLNEYGFRRKKEMTKKKQTYQTCDCFGDSIWWWRQYNETFSYYAEEHLGEQWEVLNAGISGYRVCKFSFDAAKMMGVQPDILYQCMLYDSPAKKPTSPEMNTR